MLNEAFHPRYYKPEGEWTSNFIRIRDPKYQEYLDKLLATPSLTPEGKINPDYINIAVEFVLYRLQKMFIIPTQITKKLPIYDTYYWVGFPAKDAEP